MAEKSVEQPVAETPDETKDGRLRIELHLSDGDKLTEAEDVHLQAAFELFGEQVTRALEGSEDFETSGMSREDLIRLIWIDQLATKQKLNVHEARGRTRPVQSDSSS